MIAPIFALGLVGQAAAAATPNGHTAPPMKLSKGFNLIINVTDPSTDFHPPVHNTFVASIHVGAGQSLVGNTDDAQYARIFYQNGTAEEARYRKSNIISDEGTPEFPAGLTLSPDKGSVIYSTARLDGGEGQSGITVTRFPSRYAVLAPGTWLACNEKLAYYHNQEFVVIKHARTTVDTNGADQYHVPKTCVRVNLIPECHELNKLDKGAWATHEDAFETGCYQDVSAIKWKNYYTPV